VVLLIENSVDFVLAYLATLTAGAIAVPINPKAPAGAIIEILRDCRPGTAFVEPAHTPHLSAWAQAVPELKSVVLTRSHGAEDHIEPRVLAIMDRRSGVETPVQIEPQGEDNLALIIYTSGTTGPPKGVMLSHRNMSAVTAAGRHLLGLHQNDRIGVVVPLSHLYGLREIDAALSVGATLVLPRDLSFPADVLRQLHDARVSRISSVPSALAIILERHRAELAACAEHLCSLTMGTAPTPAGMLDTLRSVLPETRLITTYGLTEASRVCWLDVTLPGSRKEIGAVGRPYAGLEVSLVEESDGIGRVVVRGDLVMVGYWGRPDITEETLTKDRTLLTPDCGRIDQDGVLHLAGRIDDVINCGGKKVSPLEVEEVLARHPKVTAAMVVGASDPAGILGQVVHALVVRRQGESLSAEELIAHAAGALEPHKVPRHVEFVERIPQGFLGKLQRPPASELP